MMIDQPLTIDELKRFENLDAIPPVPSAVNALAVATKAREVAESVYQRIRTSAGTDLESRRQRRELPDLYERVLVTRDNVELAKDALIEARRVAFQRASPALVEAHRRAGPTVHEALHAFEHVLTPIVALEELAERFGCPPPPGCSFGSRKILADAFGRELLARVRQWLDRPRWRASA